MDKDPSSRTAERSVSGDGCAGVNSYKRWYEGVGGIIVQANVEDTRLGVPEL